MVLAHLLSLDVIPSLTSAVSQMGEQRVSFPQRRSQTETAVVVPRASCAPPLRTALEDAGLGERVIGMPSEVETARPTA